MSTRSGTLTRAIAIDALTHVLTRRIHADTALERLFAHHKGLRPLDRAFIFEMVYGTLRWLSKMDWIMSHMMERPFQSLDPRVANALRVGAYQIYYMDRVPERAAVSETVEAIKSVGAANAASFVNAILRRVARKADYYAKPDVEKVPAEYYAMQFAHPQWMVERWLKVMTLERLEYLCKGNNTKPKHTLKIIQRNPLPDEPDLAVWLLKTYGVSSHWRPLRNCLHVESLPPFEGNIAFDAGCFTVQDEAAQLVASVVCPRPDDTVFDACSAPGMKVIYLWDEGLDPARIILADNVQKRMEVLSQNFKRVGLTGCEILKGDAIEAARGRVFSKVLLDAPCSALGVIRRHPEIKWLRSPADIVRNAKEQERLLDGLVANVAPRGELIYMVCSNEVEETTSQCEKFLSKHPEFELVQLVGRVHDYYRKYLTNSGELMVYPGNQDDIDGFYAAVFRKK
jgi:16S rRNA (cytosine967-C5)-methyltransferase